MTIMTYLTFLIFNSKNNEQSLMFTLNCKGRLLVVEKPLVMGIINTTPDSFYNESRFEGKDAVLKQAEQMLLDGASILDIGGQSTRPGSEKISAEQELERVLGPVESLHRHFPDAIISIDTYYSTVASACIKAGASIVNDISAGSMDPLMIETVAGLKVPYILMHMQGTPQTMQDRPVYKNVVADLLDFFSAKIPELRKAGIADIIVDPGFGFGKTITDNFELLRQLAVFKMLQCPLLLGISRKSTILSLGFTM
jgi:dihydropteroate synthase